jgi:cation diffusion facilitator CzcD-associated flavoprotein CzcO
MNKTDVVIVGAGPYGLSLAAHLAHHGTAFRIFGQPMDTWLNHMPKGMLLKSDGFASNLSTPGDVCTLRDYCATNSIPYHDTDIPVALDTFTSYGLAFQKSQVPMLEDCDVKEIHQAPNGFKVLLETGELLLTRRVVLAVGITHYAFVPPVLRAIDDSLVTHSSQDKSPERFANKDVTVIGSGASSIDLAVLLLEAGARPRIITRKPGLRFHEGPAVNPSLWHRLRHPQSGIGPGLRSRLCTDYPRLFRLLPFKTRLEIVRRHLGPAAGYPMKARTEGRVEVVGNTTVEFASENAGRAVLVLRNHNGDRREIETDHVISATGYRPDMARLQFLSPHLREKIATEEGSCKLSENFESSVKGLYFTGISAAITFGPTMRFAYGSDYTAKRLGKHLASSAELVRATDPATAKAAQEPLLRPYPKEHLS